MRIAAADGMPVVIEGFVDRAYLPDGTLVPRSETGAVHDDPATVVAQALQLAPQVESLCVHGDSPGALELARAVRAGLEDAGHTVRSFA